VSKSIALVAVISAIAVLPAAARELKGESKDAWITGRIETIYQLNAHLNGFTIDTDVRNGSVHLTGKVGGPVDRELAGELARGVEGVVNVDNDLVVDAKAGRQAGDGEHSFFRWVDDVTTTAEVKSRLLQNSNTHGMRIDVDTHGDVVTLSGTVTSPEEKRLAEQLARNAGDVKDVHNKLVVRAE